MEVFVADSLTKVFRRPEPQEPPLLRGPARIGACGHERESFQVVVAAERPLRAVVVEFSDLRSDEGEAVIPAGRAYVNPVGYVETERPVYQVDRVGWWPDPLLPPGPVDVAAGERQPFWVTVHIPASAPPGRYTGAVRVSAEDGAQGEVQVELKVWDFRLGATPPLPSAIAIYPHVLARFYGQEPLSEPTLRSYWDMLFTHRLSSDDLGDPLKEGVQAVIDGRAMPPFDYQAFDRRLEYCFARGLTAFQAARLPGFLDKGPDLTPEEQDRIVTYLSDFAGHLDERGWRERAFVMVWDEPRDEYAEQVLKELQTIRRAQPSLLGRLDGPVTGPLVNKCQSHVDIWGLHMLNIARGGAEATANVERWRRENRVLWMYVACDVRHPYPNIFIDYPLIDCRILPWLYWKHDIEGFLYWSANYWGEANLEGQTPEGKWPNRPWVAANFIEDWGGRHNEYNGDGHLIYPGPAGTALSSIRLEALRDGLEDYEYLWLLERGIQILEATGSNSDLAAEATQWLSDQSVVRSFTEWCGEPDALFTAREQLADLIARVLRAAAP